MKHPIPLAGISVAIPSAQPDSRKRRVIQMSLIPNCFKAENSSREQNEILCLLRNLSIFASNLFEMKKTFMLLACCTGLVLTFISCNNPEKKAEENADKALAEDTLSGKTKEMVDFKFFYTIANLPSPMEMISAIYASKVPFNKEILNPTTSLENYNTSFKKAVNYGIFGIDMAYAAFYGQNQDLLDYYSTTRRLAERLNILETFENFTSTFERNAGNRDSLVKIIDQAYNETDHYLKANNRYMSATHVLGGALLEAQYLSVELMKNETRTPDNNNIFEKIYNQKLYLENLISLYKEIEKDPESAKFKTGLETIKKSFDEVHSIDGLNKATLAKLSIAINSVRNDLIK